MLHVIVTDKHDKGKGGEKDTDKKTTDKITTERAAKEVVSISVGCKDSREQSGTFD